MKRILVPTDFSKCADKAIDFAVQSAKIVPVEIILLHSFEVKDNMYSDYMGVNREFNVSMLNDAKEKLAELKKNIEETDGVVVDTFISTNSLYDAITRSVKEKKIDMVVMGTLGASGIKEKLWGSRTAAIIGRSDIPVMVIPIEYEWKKPQNILLATNRFEKEPAILDYLFELAGLYMSRVQVAVFTGESDDKAITFLNHEHKISEYEEYLTDMYNEETLTSAHLTGEDFETTLQNFIRENDIDILVMVTYQNTFWSRIFNPSKTKRMSYHTNIPLLAIPVSKRDIK
ncbi:MAG TPA: universal stress protein [Chitinophagaceae bacterium]